MIKEPGYLLILILIATSFLIFFVGKWTYKKMGPRWFRTKTFIVRFILAPILFLWCFQANYNSYEAVDLIAYIFIFAVLDRIAAYADRNVPDSHPDKYR